MEIYFLQIVYATFIIRKIHFKRKVCPVYSCLFSLCCPRSHNAFYSLGDTQNQKGLPPLSGRRVWRPILFRAQRCRPAAKCVHFVPSSWLSPSCFPLSFSPFSPLCSGSCSCPLSVAALEPGRSGRVAPGETGSSACERHMYVSLSRSRSWVSRAGRPGLLAQRSITKPNGNQREAEERDRVCRSCTEAQTEWGAWHVSACPSQSPFLSFLSRKSSIYVKDFFNLETPLVFVGLPEISTSCFLHVKHYRMRRSGF